MIPKEPLEIKDFSGGITDHIFGAPLNKYQKADNLLIESYEGTAKLRSRDGSRILDELYPRPLVDKRIDYLKYIYFEYSAEEFLFAFTDSRLFYKKLNPLDPSFGAWFELKGPSGQALFTLSADLFPVSVSEWQDQLIISCGSDLVIHVFSDANESAALKAVTAGLPVPTVSSITPNTAGSSFNYLYKLIYRYEYKSGGKTYEIRGESLQKAASAGAAISNSNHMTLNSLGVINAGNNRNYDFSTIRFVIEVYRTTHNGQNFYYVGEIANGTPNYSDNVTDLDLVNKKPLYTEGGLPETGRPPPSHINHMVGNTAYYARCLETSSNYATLGLSYNRFYQSIPGAPLQVPATFYEEMPEDITGFSSYRGIKVCMLKNGSVYRLDGGFDETGAGAYEKTEISSRPGCINWNSVVQTEVGIFWAGFDGFYYTDGYRCIKVSEGLSDSYATFTGSSVEDRRLQGKFDKFSNRVWWTVQEGESGDSSRAYVLHLGFGISESMPFTTFSGGVFHTNTALEFVGPSMFRGHRYGYLLKHEPGILTDPLENHLSGDPIGWAKQAVLYDYLSVAYDFGTTAIRKLVTGMSVVCRNVTNLSLAIRSVNDGGRIKKDLKPIRFRGQVTWGDENLIWGDPTLIWNNAGVINEQRRFPSPGLRCMYKQVGFKNASVAIITSDFFGRANVSSGTVTHTKVWPDYLPGYYIAFEQDGFEKEYLILSAADIFLTFAQPSGNAQPAAASRWVIRGRPQGEFLFLSSYEIQFAMLSRSQKGYQKALSGEPL